MICFQNYLQFFHLLLNNTFSIERILFLYDNSKLWTSGVAVNMSPCHGEDRGFDSRLVRQNLIIFLIFNLFI